MNEPATQTVRISGRSCETDTLIDEVALPAPNNAATYWP